MDSEDVYIIIVGDEPDDNLKTKNIAKCSTAELKTLLGENVEKQSSDAFYVKIEPQDVEIKQESEDYEYNQDEYNNEEDIEYAEENAENTEEYVYAENAEEYDYAENAEENVNADNTEEKYNPELVEIKSVKILSNLKIVHSNMKVIRSNKKIARSNIQVVCSNPIIIEGEKDKPSKDKRYECPICLIKVKLLRKHIRRQHEGHKQKVYRKDETYNCHICTAVYKSERALEAHINAHLGRRPFKCPDCPVAYTRYTALRQHRTKHSSIVFTCDYCQKECKRKDSLIEHLKSHSSLKYQCRICQRTYALLSSLKKHIKSKHTEPDANKCHICEKTFARFYILRDHMMKQHNHNILSKRMYYNMLPKMDLPEIT